MTTQTEHKGLPDGPSELVDFAGRWYLSRNIQEQDGGTINFNGQATLTGAEHQLIYQESGMVTLANGKTIQAERTYFWRHGLDRHIDVYFEDERFFHRFSALKPFAEHLCGNDLYKVRYNFTQWPVWQSSWQVKGPRKDYTMISRYSPCKEP